MSELLENRTPPSLTADRPNVSMIDGEITVPLIEERLTVEKRVVETGKLRLLKSLQTYEESLDEPLVVRTFDIERVVQNKRVEVPPPVRQEGETTIYSLVEEQMVLTKQLIVTEEVRVTRRETERRDTRKIVLTREHLVVERDGL